MVAFNPSDTFTHTFNATWKGTTTIPLGSFVNGKFVKGDGEPIQITNPTTSSTLLSLPTCTPSLVDEAVLASQRALANTWGLNVPGATRGEILNKIGDLIEKHADEFASILVLESGKTWDTARGMEVSESLKLWRYYAGWADKNQGKVIETDKTKLMYTRHEPIGVVGQIIPWNFPLLMLSLKVAPALAMGNAILLKPSEFTSLSALKLISLIHSPNTSSPNQSSDSLLPPGVLNLLIGDGPSIGHAIASHMGVDKVAFTGSTATGRKIMRAATDSNLKHVTLELGGKSPSVICEDADLDEAVNWSLHGIYFNQGQMCCSSSRIFVHSAIYDSFLEKFTLAARAMKVGDPFAPGTKQGPVVSSVQYERILSYIKSGISEGATLHLGGTQGAAGGNGYFIPPTIFTDVKPSMRIVKEEIFGPVCVLAKFKSQDDIVELANEGMYGLGAAVFCKDVKKALNLAHAMKAGTVWVNMCNVPNAAVPFGGYKMSGIGRELGEEALANYTSVKAVHVNLGA